MGKVIAKQIRGMSWSAKIGLVLVCTLLMSVFMYQGWYKPKGAEAAIAQLAGWTSVYNSSAYPGTISNYTVPAGDKRMLVVGITSTTSSAVAQTMNSVTYNGVAMTPAANNDNGSNATHSYLFYQPLGTSATATTANIVVSMSGGTSSRTFVYAAVYSGVDQSAPIADSKAFNSGGTSSSTVGPFASALGSGDLAVEMINLTRTGSSSASSARTIQTWSTGWSSALNNTVGVSSPTQYAINAYAATRSTGTSTTSQHTASGSILSSMAAMSIKAFTGPTVTLAAPATGTPGETKDVVITGANFQSGATSNFGAGITVNSTTYTSATSLTANITIDPAATLGARTVTVTNPDTNQGSGSVFTVISAVAPTIGFVGIPTLGQNATNINETITGTNFDATTQVTVSGTGVSTTTTYVDATHLSVMVTVSGSAATGARNLIVTNGDGSTSTLAGGLTITAAPTVTAVSPVNGALGWTGNVVITGTGFQAGAGALFNGAGITVNSTTYTSATSVTANVTIAPGATLGANTVKVTNNDFGNGTSATNLFTVVNPALAPTITSVTPSQIGRGATNIPFTITGTNFVAGAVVTKSSSSLTLGSVTVVNSTTITGTFSVSGTGTSTITVTNPDTQAVTSGSITLTTYPSTPTIAPTSASLGQTLDVVVTSGNLVNGATVSFSGTGITVNSATFNTTSQLTANITIDPAAATGLRSVTVTNPDFGTRTASNIFTVSPVAVQSVAPATMAQGATQDITITGLGFATGASVAVSGSGITTNSVTFVNATTLVANVTATSGAATGARDVTVTVGSNSGTGVGMLRITGGPSLTGVSPATLRQGQVNQDVTINGANFQTGATVEFSCAGITLNSTLVSDAQIVVNVSVDQNAPLAGGTVTVTNPDGGQVTGGTLAILLTGKTIPGGISFTKVTKDAIALMIPYSGDGDNDNSAQVAYGTTAALELGTVPAVKGSGAFTANFSNLQGSGEGVGKQYFFRVIFSDNDGYVGDNQVDASQPTKGSALLHNSQNTFSSKWNQGWGIDGGKYGAFQCSTCHNENTTNSKLVATTITSPSGENWDSIGNSASLNVVLRTTLGDDSAHATSTNVCEVCHSRTSHHKYNNEGANHQGAVDCTVCHSHDEGFIPSCKTCHSTAQGAGGYRRQVVGSGGDFFTNMSTHGKFSDPSSQTCTTCHDATAHQSFSDGVSVALKHADTGARVVYDGTSASAPATTGVCLSCHDSDGATRLGIIASVPFAASEDFRTPANVNQYWPATGGAHATKMYCFNCHGNSKGADASTSNPKYNGHASGNKHVLQDKAYDVSNPNAYCFNCHAAASTDPNKSSKNISAEFALTNRHTTAKCFDCHGDENNSLDSMHSLRAGSQTAGSGVVANNISNATGRNATWAATTWGGASSFTAMASNTVSGEWQVCFKCHAATGTGTSPEVNNAAYTGAGALTNLALEFNPNNASGHPIVTGLNNYPNSVAPKALTAAKMKAPWNVNLGTQVMTCSDCHATDSAASKGPHGSSVKWMLAGTNKAWPYTSAAANGTGSGTFFRIATYATGNGTANGLFCLNCHVVTGTNNFHSSGDITGGEHGSSSSGPAVCVQCHIRVPHGGKIARLLQTTNAPGRYRANGSSTTSLFTQWGPTTGTVKGAAASSSNFNSSCSEHSGSGGEAW